MIEDAALKRIMEAAVAAAKPDIVPITADKNAGGYYMRRSDGELEFTEFGPSPRRVTLFTPADFIAAVLHFKTINVGAANVTCGRGKIMYVLRPQPFEWLRHEMPYTKAFTLLTRLAKGDNTAPPMTQAEFIRFLRVQFNGCIDKAVIEQFRNLKIVRQNDALSEVRHGRESIAAAVKNEITRAAAGGADLPDELVVETWVYETDAARQPIRCHVDINVEEAKFTLIPLAGEIEAAQKAADAAVAALLKEGLPEFTILCGMNE